MLKTTLFCSCLLALPLAGQESRGPGSQVREGPQGSELEIRDFLPVDYRSEVYVDFGALKNNGVWAAFERSLMAPFFGLFTEEFGFALGDLEELRVHLDDGSEPVLLAFRGNDNVGLPPLELQGKEPETIKLAGLDVLHLLDDDWYSVSPRRGLLVQGTESLILSVLRGARKGGVPSPELQSLVSGKGNLFYVVAPVPEDQLDRMGIPGLPEDWYAEDDLPRLMAFRVRQTGDEDTGERIVFQATVRHEKGDKGPARLKELVEQGLDWLAQHPRLGAFKRYWKAVEVQADGIDLVVSLDLGPPREAAGVLPMMLSPALMLGRAEAAPAAAPAAAPEKPADPKKGPDKGKKDGDQDKRP